MRWPFLLDELRVLIGWWMRELRMGWDPPIRISIGLIGLRGSNTSVLIRIDLSVGSVVLIVFDVLKFPRLGSTRSSATFLICPLLISFSCFLNPAAHSPNLSLLSTASFNSPENFKKYPLKNPLWSLNFSISLIKYPSKYYLQSSYFFSISFSIFVFSARSPDRVPASSRCLSLRWASCWSMEVLSFISMESI